MDDSRALFARLSRFDSFIVNTRSSKVFLLLDNCSAHGSYELLPELQSVRVHFLPPNPMSQIQQFYAGIIASLKAQYLHRLLFLQRQCFDNRDAEARIFYNVDILTAMRWVQEAWNNLSFATVFYLIHGEISSTPLETILKTRL